MITADIWAGMVLACAGIGAVVGFASGGGAIAVCACSVLAAVVSAAIMLVATLAVSA